MDIKAEDLFAIIGKKVVEKELQAKNSNALLDAMNEKIVKLQKENEELKRT